MFGKKGLSPTGGNGRGDGPGNGSGGGRPGRRDLAGVLEQGGSIDRAASAAIALFTETLRAADLDPGALAGTGPIPENLNAMLADCITYDGNKGREYVTLGTTRDFKAFSYQPHCFLFLISNAALICQDFPDVQVRAPIAAPECIVPLFHAHVLRRWSRYVLPIGTALGRGDDDALGGIMRALLEDIFSIVDDAPEWMRERGNLQQQSSDWGSGFPSTIGRLIDTDVKRLNDIPMSDFVHQTLVDWMAKMQAQSMHAQHRSG